MLDRIVGDKYLALFEKELLLVGIIPIVFLFCLGWPPDRRDLWKTYCFGALGIESLDWVFYSLTGAKLFLAIFETNLRVDDDLLALFKSMIKSTLGSGDL